MEVVQFVADALGDASYLVVSGNHAAVVDPQRDIRAYLAAAEQRGATIGLVFETHVHNDYISGGRELAALGAKVVVPAGSGLQFPHIELSDSADIAVGGAALRAMHAPGHTFEHTAYLAVDENQAVTGAFTGGAILMAAAGRSDLLGPDHAPELALLQWQTAHRLAATLPPSAEILPTHGAGSFCSSSGTMLERRGALSVERERNPVFMSSSFDAFQAAHLSSLPPIPAYYRHMAPINRAGPRVFGTPPLPSRMAPAKVEAALGQGIHVVDVRPRSAYLEAHIPGTLHIPDCASFLAYVSWVLPFNAPVALLVESEAQAQRLAVDLLRIGYEDVRGFGTWADWKGSGRTVESLPALTVEETRSALESGDRVVLDVRFQYEQRALPLAGALARPMEELSSWLTTAPERAVVVCASGERATVVASAIRREGMEAVPLSHGGAADLRE